MVAKNLLFAEVLPFGPIHGISLCKGTEGINEYELLSNYPVRLLSGHSFYIPFWRSHSSTYGDNPKETLMGWFQMRRGIRVPSSKSNHDCSLVTPHNPHLFLNESKNEAVSQEKHHAAIIQYITYVFSNTFQGVFPLPTHKSWCFWQAYFSYKNPLWNYQTPSHQFYKY